MEKTMGPPLAQNYPCTPILDRHKLYCSSDRKCPEATDCRNYSRVVTRTRRQRSPIFFSAEKKTWFTFHWHPAKLSPKTQPAPPLWLSNFGKRTQNTTATPTLVVNIWSNICATALYVVDYGTKQTFQWQTLCSISPWLLLAVQGKCIPCGQECFSFFCVLEDLLNWKLRPGELRLSCS